MAEAADLHPTAGRRRRDKGPPSALALPRLERVSDTEGEHSDDSAGEKEAKRQRSEPTTPVSTSGRLPYDYDAVMGITKVGTKEAEGFDEDLDTAEYHDAAEEPTRKEETDDNILQQRSPDFQGGYGSSSLKECIELLNTLQNCPCSTRLWGRSKFHRSSTGYEPKRGRYADRCRSTDVERLKQPGNSTSDATSGRLEQPRNVTG